MSSSLDTDAVMTCMACGASIYKEHIDRGLAGMWGGQLLCPACRKAKQDGDGGGDPGKAADQLGSLPLKSEADMEAAGEVSDAAAGRGELGLADAVAFDDLSYPSSSPATGARHVRTFHSKLSEGAVRHLDEQINAWLANHPQIEIKFANTTVGTWEGKHPEPNLILMVFY